MCKEITMFETQIQYDEYKLCNDRLNELRLLVQKLESQFSDW